MPVCASHVQTAPLRDARDVAGTCKGEGCRRSRVRIVVHQMWVVSCSPFLTVTTRPVKASEIVSDLTSILAVLLSANES